jgi:nitrogen fixation protein FixH
MAKVRQRGWWYPYIFVGGFAVVLGVNLTLLYFATSTFNGLVSKTAYEDGVAYNDEISAARLQDALGWSGQIALSGEAGGKDGAWPAMVSAHILDETGTPVLRGLAVTAEIRRPTQAGYDQTLTLTAGTDGQWRAPVTLPFQGQWEVRLVARLEDREAAYRMRDRFILTP